MTENSKYSNNNCSDSDAYKDQDADVFTALNDHIKRRQPYSTLSERKRKREKMKHHNFSYSASDTANFERILPEDVAFHPQQASTSDGDSNNSEGAYLRSDNEQFKKLMDFKVNNEAGRNESSPSSNNNERSFNYSDQDLQRFNQYSNSNQKDTQSQKQSGSKSDSGNMKTRNVD